MRTATWLLLLGLVAVAAAEMTLSDIEVSDDEDFAADVDFGEEESDFDAMTALELDQDDLERVNANCISVGGDCTVTSGCKGTEKIAFRCENYKGKGAYRLTFSVDAGANEKVPGCTVCKKEEAEGGPTVTSSRGIRNSSSCRRLGGSCWDTSKTRCNGRTKSGLCPGSSAVKCCIPNIGGGSAVPNSPKCAALKGMCTDTSKERCAGVTQSGLCAGSSSIKCCIPGSVEQGPKCVARKGICIDSKNSPCTGELLGGMCPGPSHFKCCAPPGVPPPLDHSGGIANPGKGPRPRPAARVTCANSRSGMQKLVPIPTDLIKNQLGLTYPRQSTMKQYLGTPCPLRKDCGGITNKALIGKLKRAKIGHITIYGMSAAVDSLERILSRVRKDLPDVFRYVKSSGMVCCRAIRGSKKSFSNHSWGMAIDFNIDGILDPRKDAKTQCALLAMYPYFNEEGWFWAAGYSAKYEDAMHFEVAEQTVKAWKAAGKI